MRSHCSVSPEEKNKFLEEIEVIENSGKICSKKQ